MRFRFAVVLLTVAAGVVVSACSQIKAPNDPVTADGSAVVYGRITSTSGLVVPGATAIVELFADTIRVYTALQCGGLLLTTASQQLDAEGNYRVEVVASGAAGKSVCVEVTGDPHGLYSDVGLKRQYAGWIELRNAAGNAAPTELRVDVRYTETP